MLWKNGHHVSLGSIRVGRVRFRGRGDKAMRIKEISGYLPETKVFSEELDLRFGWNKGTAYQRSGVQVRHFLGETETSVDMAERAYAKLARRIAEKGEALSEPDVLIGTSGTPLQTIPFNAAFYKDRLFPSAGDFPAFDVNSTCLGFMWGLQLAYTLPFDSALLISSDVASCGLNWDHWESSLIFGDGAAACLLEKDGTNRFIFHFATYAEGKEYCQIRAGGNLRHPHQCQLEPEDYLFAMDGKKVFKLVSKHTNDFVSTLLRKADVRMADIAVVIPHQASGLALQHLKKQLHFSEEQIVDIFATHGNQIATSVPMTLFRAVESGRVKRGDKVMLLGSSAGVSLGGAVFEY